LGGGEAPVPTDNWFDDFDGALDTGRWGTSVSGSGSITSGDDSRLRFQAPAAADAALLYQLVKVDKTKSQAWTFRINPRTISDSSPFFWIINRAGTPSPAVVGGAFDADRRIQAALMIANPDLALQYYNGTHTLQSWNGSAYVGGNSGFRRVANDSFFDLTFETDGPGNRWRFSTIGRVATAAGDDPSLGGWQLALTDWILWTSLESSTDLWLVVGEQWTDGNSVTGYIEHVKYAGDALRLALTNGKDTLAGAYDIRCSRSHDLQSFSPHDRTTIAVARGGAGTWDASNVKDPDLVQDGATVRGMYSGHGTTSGFQIGAFSGTSVDGVLTKDAGNPIITLSAGTHEGQVFMPKRIKDTVDPDGNKLWKVMYTGFSDTDAKFRVFVKMSASPNSGYGASTLLLSPGGVGEFDELGCSMGCHVRYGGIDYIFYAGAKTGLNGNLWQVGLATGTFGTSFTKQGVVIARAQTADALTAALNSKTVTIADTSAYSRDELFLADDDATNDNYVVGKIRKITNGTNIESLISMNTNITTPNGRIFRMGVFSVHPREILREYNKWYLFCSSFGGIGDGTRAAFYESTLIFTNPSSDPGSGAWTPEYKNAPHWPVNAHGFARSNENPALVRLPIT
jgi:hypothetical protein